MLDTRLIVGLFAAVMSFASLTAQQLCPGCLNQTPQFNPGGIQGVTFSFTIDPLNPGAGGCIVINNVCVRSISCHFAFTLDIVVTNPSPGTAPPEIELSVGPSETKIAWDYVTLTQGFAHITSNQGEVRCGVALNGALARVGSWMGTTTVSCDKCSNEG